jgi:hypothetical protein
MDSICIFSETSVCDMTQKTRFCFFVCLFLLKGQEKVWTMQSRGQQLEQGGSGQLTGTVFLSGQMKLLCGWNS